MSEQDARTIWFEGPMAVLCGHRMTTNGTLLGTYTYQAQPCPGAALMSAIAVTLSDPPKARGKGIATSMCDHIPAKAQLKIGFSAMQFNFVVASNEGAVRLWQRLGLSIIGTLPKVFDHPLHGLIDAHVMFKSGWVPA